MTNLSLNTSDAIPSCSCGLRRGGDGRRREYTHVEYNARHQATRRLGVKNVARVWRPNAVCNAIRDVLAVCQGW